MKYLMIKMRRDLLKMWPQFLTVFLMAFLGVFIYVGMEGAWNGLKTQYRSYFEETNLASAWIYGKGIDNTDYQNIKENPDIEKATLAATFTANEFLEDSVNESTIKITAFNETDISHPYLVSGEEFSNEKSGIWLDSDYAKYNDKNVGDIIVLDIEGITMEYEIKGLILSSENLYYTGSNNIVSPNHKIYGYGYISKNTAVDLTNQLLMSQIQDNVLPEIREDITNAYATAVELANEEVEIQVKNQFYEKAIAEAKAQLDSYYNSIGNYSSEEYNAALKEATQNAVNLVDQEFKEKSTYLLNILNEAKKQAESKALELAKEEIMKSNDLTQSQFKSLEEILDVNNIHDTQNSNERSILANTFIPKIISLPDSFLNKDVEGISLSTVKETSLIYTEMRIITKDSTDLKNLRDEIQTILDERYLGFIDRDNQYSVSYLVTRAEQIKSMSFLFSFVFLLLALLTMQTTMARLVDTQRIQIGTFKAIGIRNIQIGFHYSLYGLFVGLIGGLVGLALGPAVVSPILLNSLKSLYSMPNWSVRITPISIVVVLLVALSCMIAAILTCKKVLKNMPAITMRGMAPKSGSKVNFERLPRIWNKIPFEWKWSIRDIARNKVRTVMGIVGVLGCMVLMIASLGVQDSLDAAYVDVYENEYTYVSKLALDSSITDSEEKELTQVVGGQWIQESSIEYQGSTNKTGTLTILDKGDFVHLKDKSGKNIVLGDGVYVTEAVAKLMKLGKGDKIAFRDISEEDYIIDTIIDIVNVPSPQGIFISTKRWEELNQEFKPTAMLTEKDEVLKLPYIKETILLKSQLESIKTNNASFEIIYRLLQVAAVMLGIVILYNLGILSFTERTREYATMKVLGFRQGELRSFALRENLATTLFGWVCGIPVGIWFLGIYVSGISDSNFVITPRLSLMSFLIASFITIGCSLSVILILNYRVKKIIMVEALKTVE